MCAHYIFYNVNVVLARRENNFSRLYTLVILKLGTQNMVYKSLFSYRLFHIQRARFSVSRSRFLAFVRLHHVNPLNGFSCALTICYRSSSLAYQTRAGFSCALTICYRSSSLAYQTRTGFLCALTICYRSSSPHSNPYRVLCALTIAFPNPAIHAKQPHRALIHPDKADQNQHLECNARNGHILCPWLFPP